MPTFHFKDPNGRTHTIKGPPGSTPEQAMEVLTKMLGGSQAFDKQQREPPPIQGFDDPGGTLEQRAGKMATDGMSWPAKAAANVGAGLTQFGQGTAQLFGGGPNDEELKKTRATDEALADSTFGGGLIQGVGQALPTIPMGLGATAAARGVGGLAARVAASPTASAAGGGALAGLTMPVTSDESRGMNTLLSAAGSAAVPSVLKLSMKGARGAGQMAERAAAGLPGRLGEGAAQRVGTRRAGELLEKELPGGVGPDVYTPHPFLRGNTPSAAVATQDPRIASLELGNRTAVGDDWVGYDKGHKQGRWGAIDTLETDADLQGLLTRANEIGADTAQVYKAVGKQKFNQEMDDFYNLLQQAKSTAPYHGNPSVKAAVDYIESTMESAGTVTPELLHTIRRTVGSGLQGVPGVGDAGARAASSEPFVISLTKAIDRVLDNASKGKYGQWKGDYAHQMTKVDSAKADINIRSRFIDPATGIPRKPVVGLDDVPEVTGSALKQAIAAAGSRKRGPLKGRNMLSTGSEDVLQGVVRDLDAHDILNKVKASKTGGGGSTTASNLAQLAIMESMLPSGLGVGRFLMNEGGRKGNEAMQRQLAQLLQNPAELRRFIAARTRQQMLRGQTPGLLPGMAAALPLMLGG